MKKVADIIFIAVIVASITLGLITTLFGKKEINEYENRYAESIDKLTVAGYMDGSFQDSVEPALADRIPYAEDMKKAYNDITSGFIKTTVEQTVSEEVMENKYIKIGDRNLFGDDYIVFNTSVYEWLKGSIDKRVGMFNAMAQKYPEVEFFLYYIEKDTDINFETGEKVGVFEHLYETVNFKKENIARFEINSFEEFSECFYKTDHHWNEEGAHRGYEGVLKLLDNSQKPLMHGKKVKVGDCFAGSKATGETAGYSEEFFGYGYKFPRMDITINGEKATDYGDRDAFLNGLRTDATYPNFYGGDMGEIIFDTKNADKDDILIIGESYDNAILKPLATHFNKTYSIDLRYYEAMMGEKFNFEEYIKKHNINKVLMIGNVDYIIFDDFIVEE